MASLTMVGPTLRQYVHRYVPKLLSAQHVRNWAAWSEWNPVDGQAYQALFQQRMTEPSAYLDFAVSLRERDDLPEDLLAVLQKDLAGELLRQAAEKSETLQVESEPWPQELKDQLIQDLNESLKLMQEGQAGFEDPKEIEKFKCQAHELIIEVHRSELFWVRYQLLYIRAKCAALRRCDLPEAQSIGRRMAAAGLPSVGEEELLLRSINCARAVYEATAAAAESIPSSFADKCQRELAVTLASDLADLGMARYKANDEDQAQKYMSEALGTLSKPKLVLDNFEKFIFRSTAEKLHQDIKDTACAVDAQVSAGSLELAAAIDTFKNQHGSAELCA